MKPRVVLLLVLISLIAPQCGSPLPQGRWGVYVENTSITRIVDYEAQVVCWTTGSNSINCLPISDTALSGEKPGANSYGEEQ